jgi:hypothetical protein
MSKAMRSEMFPGELLHFDSALQAHDPILTDRIFRSGRLEHFSPWRGGGRFIGGFQQNPLLFRILHVLQGKKSLYENLFDFFERHSAHRRLGPNDRSSDLQ